MDVGFRTENGIRRMNNEDAFFVMKNDRVFIIADGVGGNNSGEIASRTAVNEVAGYIEDHSPVPRTRAKIREYFMEAVRAANFRVYDLAQRYRENHGMATTITISYFSGRSLHVVNVGDSRCYLYSEGRLSQLTEDHTYVNALVKAGVISRKQASERDDKNMITRAIGAENDIKPDFFDLKLKSGDIILMCTDGLYGEVPEDEIGEILAVNRPMSETCYQLAASADKHGGRDNITVICIKVTEDDFI